MKSKHILYSVISMSKLQEKFNGIFTSILIQCTSHG